MDYSSFSGKVALITGASSGIGAATAERFASLGMKLALTGRSPARLEDTAKNCVQAGTKRKDILIISGDLTKTEDVKRIVDKSATHFGGLNFLINCAGCIKSGSMVDTSDQQFSEVFMGNVKMTFTVCRQAIPHLVNTKGAIVNLSSFVAIKPCFSYFAYSMSGAAIDHMTRALALELGASGVRVNSVNPAIVKGTRMWTREGAPFEGHSEEQLEEMFQGMKSMYPLRRVACVDDVTPAIAFLCSDKAGFVTGSVMPIDGGKSLTSKAAPDCIPAKKV